MQPSVVGIFAGLILGLAAAVEGVEAMFMVAFFGLVGWLVARVLEGELDLSQYLGGPRSPGRRDRP